MANVALPTNAVDLAGLSDLRRRAQHDDPSALSDVAMQFEAMFIGMMLESARSASLGGGVFDSSETEQYLSLMDRQVALELARHGGFGFGKMLEQQLAPRAADPSAPAAPATLVGGRTAPEPALAAGRISAEVAEFPRALPSSLVALGGVTTSEKQPAPTPTEFVTALLPEAEAAAAELGVEPRLLLAQAALETGWGRALPQRGGESAHNLFGIKAGKSWSGPSVEQWTLEHMDGVTAPQRDEFRAYGSAAESFADYVGLISGSRRYAEALGHGGNPEAYARAVTKAGYATDPQYADKWLAVYNGDRLENAMRGIDLPPAKP
jgi:flagellar protein FlgJ